MTTYKRITKLTIERSKWLRGDAHSSRLLNDAGRMCCLGFAAIASGAEPNNVVDHSYPSACDMLIPLLTEFVHDEDPDVRDTMFSRDAIEINDNPDITDDVREAELTALFASKGVELEFVP